MPALDAAYVIAVDSALEPVSRPDKDVACAVLDAVDAPVCVLLVGSVWLMHLHSRVHLDESRPPKVAAMWFF